MENSTQNTSLNFSERVQEDGSLMRFILVTNDNGILSEEMEIAHEALLDKVPAKRNIIIMEPDDCLNQNIEDLPTDTVFIMDKFEGPVFRHIEAMESIYILGVKTVCSVLNDNIRIPSGQYHLHNLFLKGQIICFASIPDKKEKNTLKKMIKYMGGISSNGLIDVTTHLITEDIHSQKYYFANEHKMKVMKPIWIKDMWKNNQSIDFKMSADDPSFDSYNLPMFYDVRATSTGIEFKQKEELMKMLDKYGGDFLQTFNTATVNMLIINDPKDIDSVKGKAAIKYKIKCLLSSWVADSVAAGYAQPLDNYIVKKSCNLKASTPTKDGLSVDKFAFNSTALSDIASLNSTSISKQLVFDETQRSMKASTTRFSNAKNDTFKKPPQPLRLAPATRTSSVSSIRSINNEEKIPSRKSNHDNESDGDESYIQILSGKNVFIYGYLEETDLIHMMNECEKLGANVVDASFTKQVDYIVTPSNLITLDEPRIKSNKMVNDYWIEESLSEGKCVDLKFYHNPIFQSCANSELLQDELFVLSSYELERQKPYIKFLISCLGGRSTDVLNKKVESILICPQPEGKKFEGALKWGITVLTADWLYACYKHKMRYDEVQFLVGDALPSRRNKKNNRESIIPNSQGTPTESDNMEVDLIEYKENNPVMPKRVAELRPRFNDSLRTPEKSFENEDALSISNLVADMPTPQREITKAALLEGQSKNIISPRAQRQKELLKTPGMTQKYAFEESSPMPELPDLMRPPPVNQAIRADASPDSQWYWKMKMDTLDEAFLPKSESTKKAIREGLQTTPYEQKRFDFFKSRIPNYDSPDPRLTGNNESREDDKSKSIEEIEIEKRQNELLKLLKSAPREEEKRPVKRRTTSTSDFRKQLDLDDEDLGGSRVVWANSLKDMEDYRKAAVVESQCEDRQMNVDATTGEDSPIHVMTFSEETGSSEVEDDESQVKTFAVSSGGNTEERAQIERIINELGGKLVEEDFNYLIMPKLSKSSKFFCALARGSFILHKDFIMNSMEAKKFIETDPFEYGNPKFKCNILGTKVSDEIIKGPYNCRMAVLNNEEKFANGLFTGMNFLIVAATDKRDIFCHIIEFGGGNIINEQPEFKAAVLKREKIDYCLVDNPTSINPRDVKTLQSCGIPIKNVRFIYEYLLSDNL